MRWRSPAPYSLLRPRLFWPVSVYNSSPNSRAHLQFFVLILSTTHSLPPTPYPRCPITLTYCHLLTLIHPYLTHVIVS